MESQDVGNGSSSTVSTSSTGNPTSGPAAQASSSSSSSSIGGATAAAAAPSPSSTSGPSTAASSSVPADGGPGRILSSTAVLARDASGLFQSGRYHDCLDVLHQLLQKEDDNPKVLHNIAVAQYFRDGSTDPQKLLDVLSNVKRRREEMNKRGGEHVEVIYPATSNTLSANSLSLKGSNSTLIGAASSSVDASTYVEDYDTSISTYNTAVILYHLQQFATALSVLEPLYQNIEPIDEPAALRICLLMLDITLASCQLRKAADVFHYMERVFGLGFFVSATESGSSAPSQSTLLSTTSDSAATLRNSGTFLSSALNSSTALEASLTRSSSEEALDEEALTLELEGSHSIKSSGPLSMLSGTTRVSSLDRTPSAPRDSNVKLLLHLYKVRLLLRAANIKAAKREVKFAMNLARGRDYLTALILKAQLEYLRGNLRKAVKLLVTCSSREPGMRSTFLNNLGCVHHQLRKDHTAYVFFLKALQSCATSAIEKPLKLSTFSQDRSLSILYNCGLQQLRSGNPVVAARCLQEAGALYYNQPLMWLRLAECCISAMEKGLLEVGGYDASIKKDEFRVHSFGEGRWRKLVLPGGSLNPTLPKDSAGMMLEDGEGSTAKFTNFFVPGVPFQISLVFARQCLHNAMHLLKQLNMRSANEVAETTLVDESPQDGKNISNQKAGSMKGGNTLLLTSSNGNMKESKASSTGTITASLSIFEEEKSKQRSSIMQYVLADLAFVELCLENPIKALKTSEKLLQDAECAKPFKFLGHMYAAEALCLLNRPKEAAAYLASCVSETSSFELPTNGSDEDGQKWKSGDNSEASGEGDDGGSNVVGNNTLVSGTLPEALSLSSLTGTRARASLFVNLAMVNVMQGDLSQAHQYAMQAVSITPANPMAVLSVVYVELVQGRTHEAVSFLKHCRHLCVVNSKKC